MQVARSGCGASICVHVEARIALCGVCARGTGSLPLQVHRVQERWHWQEFTRACAWRPLAVFYYKGVYTVVRGLSKSITRIGDGTGQHHHQSPTGNSGDMQRYGAGLCAVERQCIFVGKVRRIVSLDGRWILCRMGAFIADVRRARAHAHPSPGDQAHAQASCAWAYAWA